MKWDILNELTQIEEIHILSNEIPVLIYKHSTRCSTSRMVLDRLDDQQRFRPFFLDLITYREISNAIATIFMVEHQSPQVLLIEKGQSIYNSSHYEINYQDIIRALKG